MENISYVLSTLPTGRKKFVYSSGVYETSLWPCINVFIDVDGQRKESLYVTIRPNKCSNFVQKNQGYNPYIEETVAML